MLSSLSSFKSYGIFLNFIVLAHPQFSYKIHDHRYIVQPYQFNVHALSGMGPAVFKLQPI